MVPLPIAVTRIISRGTANHCADACQVSAAAKQDVKLTGNVVAPVKCCEIPLPLGEQAPGLTDRSRAREHFVAASHLLKLINFRNEAHSSPMVRFWL